MAIARRGKSSIPCGTGFPLAQAGKGALLQIYWRKVFGAAHYVVCKRLQEWLFKLP